jgi:hypothetical protein
MASAAQSILARAIYCKANGVMVPSVCVVFVAHGVVDCAFGYFTTERAATHCIVGDKPIATYFSR